MVYLMRKKFLQGVLTLGMAAAICFGASAVRADAAVQASNIKVNGETQTMTISSTDKEILVGFAAKGQKSGKTTFKVASWDVYEPESGTVTVDLSHLNSAKDNFVEVKDLEGNKTLIKIPAAAKKCIASYDASKDELGVKAGASKSAATAATSFEYRTAVGSWTDGETLTDGKTTAKFEKYQRQGATLYLRIPGEAASDGSAAAIEANSELTDVYEADDLTEDGKIATTYKSVSLPSKEVKLKIAKQAKSPKVAVNYVKAEVTIPANTEYRLYGDTDFVKADGKTKITANASKLNVAVGDLLKKDATTNYSEGFIEVRTTANTSKKKAASKWAHIDLENPVELSASELKAITQDTSTTTTDPNCINALSGNDTDGWKSLTQTTAVKDDVGGTVKYGGCGVANAKVTDGETAPKDLVTVKYGAVNKNSTGQVILENKGDTAYQVVVKESRTATISDSDKASMLKAGNGKTLTLKNLKTGQWIFIRKAGVQKEKKWVGVYKVMGVVDIPLEKKVEKKETPTT